MGRKNWKARGYDPVRKTRTMERWSREKIYQLLKETKSITEEREEREKEERRESQFQQRQQQQQQKRQQQKKKKKRK